MSSIGPKPSRLRLHPVSYESLRQQILRRDGWRCQSCGTMTNLEAHPQGVPQPIRTRLRGELDHTVRGMPRQSAWRLRP